MAEDEIAADIWSLVSERVLMWLVGELDPDLNFLERKAIIAARLGEARELPAAVAKDLVADVAKLQAAIIGHEGLRKSGIGSIDEHRAGSLIAAQGGRCAVCGVPVKAAARQPTSRFHEGLEPMFPMELDHVLPFYLTGDSGPLRILCKACNILKSDRIGVQEDGVVFCGNHLRRRGREYVVRRAAFWALDRTRRCAQPGCHNGSSTSMMWVSRRDSTRAMAYGNLVVKCSAHAPEEAWWLHEQMLGIL